MDNFSLEFLKYFNKLPLVLWKTVQEDQVFTYEGLIKISIDLITIFRKCNVIPNSRISLHINHSPTFIASIISILNIASSFCPIPTNISHEKILKYMELYKSNILISDHQLNLCKDLIQLDVIKLFDTYFHIYKFTLAEADNSITNLCYSICTSGTTGSQKVVHVPYDCILPNIVEMSKIFDIKGQDVIFVSSPFTFDPFVVDVFLALRNGASLLMIDNTVKLSVDLFQNILCGKGHFKATIMQITPSLLKKKIPIHNIFNINSNIRILSLGGESFPPVEEFCKWQNWDSPNRIRVFNIYGITEVSCWSMIEEVKNCSEKISLGNSLDNETLLEVRDKNSVVLKTGTGELYIGSSSRKCLINDENVEILKSSNILFRPTGDLVTLKNGKYFYKCRINDVVKRFGYRIYLKKIEATIKKLKYVKDAYCAFNEHANLIILFIVLDDCEKNNVSKRDIINFVKEKLENFEQPDDYMFIESLKISKHGKICRAGLFELYNRSKENHNYNLREMFIEKIIERLNLPKDFSIENVLRKGQKSIWDSSFLNLGGDSILALSLISELEYAKCPHQSEFFLMLMNADFKLNDIFVKLEEFHIPSYSKIDQTSLKVSTFKETITCKVDWKWNLYKCVDASPTISCIKGKPVISVGSHSHVLINIDSTDGSLISSIILPDRIEGKINFLPDRFGIVGCYNGFLYKFDILCGEILETFDSKGMIKASTLVLKDWLLFGNYSNENNLFCLNNENFTERWSLKLGKKGIFSSPISMNESLAIVCTLDGICSAIDIHKKIFIFETKFASPIFSTCRKISDNFFVVAEVAGLIHCLDCNGIEKWNFNCNANIFSSFELFATSNHISIYFGCYDKSLYCLNLSTPDAQPYVNWKLSTDSFIYSTPTILKLFSKYYIVCTSKNGSLYVINNNNNRIVSYHKLSDEIFSSPLVYENRIYVGCRDNYLYCFRITS